MGDPAARRMAMEDFKNGFFVGFGDRVDERISELADSRRAARTTASSTALVAGKQALIARKLAELGLSLKTVSYREDRGSAAGANAGRAAGSSVGLGRPITGSRAGGPLSLSA